MKRLLLILGALLVGAVPCFAAVDVAVNVVTSDVSTITGDWDTFRWDWSGYDTQSNRVWVKRGSSWVSMADTKMGFKISRNTETGVLTYVSTTNITVSGSNCYWTVANTNVPPVNDYLAELFAWSGSSTNISRTYAQGKIRVHQSLYGTDDSTYPFPTNYYSAGTGITISGNIISHSDMSTLTSDVNTGGVVLASYYTDGIGHMTNMVEVNLDSLYYREGEITTLLTSYLLIAGTRAMTGNLNMGGHSITNVDDTSLTFEGGQTITAAKVQLWDGYAASTNAITIRVTALEASTGVLNTAVGNLQTATNALNTRAGNLESATNALNGSLTGFLRRDGTTTLTNLWNVGDQSITNIDLLGVKRIQRTDGAGTWTCNTNAIQMIYASDGGTATAGSTTAYPAMQLVTLVGFGGDPVGGTAIASGAGSIQAGLLGASSTTTNTALWNNSGHGSFIHGYVNDKDAHWLASGYGATIAGRNNGYVTASGNGAMILTGTSKGSSITNSGNGSLILGGNGTTNLLLSDDGSILACATGSATNSHKSAAVFGATKSSGDGTVTATGGFYGTMHHTGNENGGGYSSTNWGQIAATNVAIGSPGAYSAWLDNDYLQFAGYGGIWADTIQLLATNDTAYTGAIYVRQAISNSHADNIGMELENYGIVRFKVDNHSDTGIFQFTESESTNVLVYYQTNQTWDACGRGWTNFAYVQFSDGQVLGPDYAMLHYVNETAATATNLNRCGWQYELTGTAPIVAQLQARSAGWWCTVVKHSTNTLTIKAPSGRTYPFGGTQLVGTVTQGLPAVELRYVGATSGGHVMYQSWNDHFVWSEE